MAQRLSLEEYQSGILSGSISTLSRAITLVESTLPEDNKIATSLIDSLLPYTGKSIRIGITGVPGVGKSTFIETMGMYLLSKGKKLAVLAIDPSSSMSKGSILGDKTRMEQLSVQENAFIRPTASAGSLGGVSYKTHETLLLCEAAGFDTIFIETVGVGQSETEVSQICDFFLLLMLAGAGDELQGIKKGIMELADAVVITKADGANLIKAKAARADFARALHFLPQSSSGWIPQVLVCSALETVGFTEIWSMIEQYVFQSQVSGYFYQKRRDQNSFAFHRLLQEYMRQAFFSKIGLKEEIQKLDLAIQQGQISPYSALQNLLVKINL